MRDTVYLGVAGACAEQAKNSAVEYIDLSDLSLDSTADYGASVIEVLMSPTELIVGEHSSQNAKSYTFTAGSIPSFASANDTLSYSNLEPRAFGFGDDGTYFYVGRNHSTRFRRYTLSTPYDIGTAGSGQNSSLSLSWSPQGLHLHPDGDTMYACAGNNIYKLTMSTNWQISSGLSVTTTYNVSSDTDGLGDPVGGLTGIRFSPTGLKMYVSYRYDTSNTETGSQGHSKVTQYDLSTAWDVSTRSVNSTIDLHSDIGYYSFTPPPPPPPPPDPPTPGTGIAALVAGLDFSPDGQQLIVASAHADQDSSEYRVLLYK